MKGIVNPHPHLPLYFARSPYIHQEGGLGSTDIYRQCFVNSIGINAILNVDFPMISANQGIKGFTYDVSDILNNHEIFEQLTADQLPKNGVQILRNVTQLVVFETQGIDKQKAISEPYWFLNAMVPPDYMEAEFGFYKQTFDKSQGLLTNRNHSVLTDVNCPQYVYYCNTLETTPTELTLKCFVRRKNGTSETVVIQKVTNLLLYDILCGNVSLSKLPNPETISYYTAFFAESDAVTVNKPAHFLPDRNNPETVTYLLFRNLYGIFETLRCTGETSVNYEYEHQVFDSNSKQIDYSTQAHEVYIFNTGEVSSQELKFLAQELMTSPEIYLITDLGNVQLSKTTKSMMLYDPSKPYDSATFEMRKAKTDTF